MSVGPSHEPVAICDPLYLVFKSMLHLESQAQQRITVQKMILEILNVESVEMFIFIQSFYPVNILFALNVLQPYAGKKLRLGCPRGSFCS